MVLGGKQIGPYVAVAHFRFSIDEPDDFGLGFAIVSFSTLGWNVRWPVLGYYASDGLCSFSAYRAGWSEYAKSNIFKLEWFN